jgi:hypothetical protein
MGTNKMIKQIKNVASGNKSNDTKHKGIKETKKKNKQPDNQVYKGGN